MKDDRLTILEGDCRETLKTLPDASIHCCVTSPPYFGLRDYGHNGQIGLEQSPDDYVAQMVSVFREVYRVLRDDGTVWLNIGDSYGATGGDTWSGFNARYNGTGLDGGKQAAIGENAQMAGSRKVSTGLRPKNLLGIPWRVAFALQADGWWLRQEIIWHKPNPMPESVTDRCTKSHEHIFLLSKSERYFFDADAIAEKSSSPPMRPRDKSSEGWHDGCGTSNCEAGERIWGESDKRNKRSVWTIPTAPYKGAHFATFPPALIEPCILAGCPRGGTVLDPFGGSGTTAQVAIQHGRKAILCELNPEYIKLIHQRCEWHLNDLFSMQEFNLLEP